MKKLKCQRCEFEFGLDLSHCPRCGQSADARPRTVESTPAVTPRRSPPPQRHSAPTPPPPPPRKSDSGAGGLAAAFGIIVAVIVIVGVYSNEPSSTSRPTGTVSVAQPATITEKYYVTADALNIRAASNAQSQIVGKAQRWESIDVLEINNGWAKIDRGRANPAYVSAKYIQRGSGQIAERRYCQDNAGQTPRNGEVLSRSLRRGFHEFTVVGGPSPTVVKMKDPSGGDVLSFYVAPRSTVVIDTIPDGRFSIFFASGATWSRQCERFVPAMNVSRDPNPVLLTGNANGSYYRFGYELAQQVNGNFRPSNVRAEDF